ncbi:MAG: CPBP family intramembrane glutamic endopeptidase [Cyclobacteriaceae bacterium]
MSESTISLGIVDKKKGSFFKDLTLPILVWAGMIILFLNIQHIPYDFSERDGVTLRFFAKVLATILLPLVLVRLIYKKRGDFGIYFPTYRESFQLSWKAFSLAGPACVTFLLIGLLGWSFEDWKGAIILSMAFGMVTYLIPKRIYKMPTRESNNIPNRRIISVTVLSVMTLVIVYLTYHSIPVLWKMFYYVFIVAFGEELFFRGYLQSATNRYFNKPFSLYGVKFGWGLVLAAVLFGLSHALVTTPPTWPWAVWTGILGLAFGYIREKDGSILAAAILHAMVDFPLAFMS